MIHKFPLSAVCRLLMPVFCVLAAAALSLTLISCGDDEEDTPKPDTEQPKVGDNEQPGNNDGDNNSGVSGTDAPDASVQAGLCPDSHHPHIIDLGIGTRWACCNVGASAPEKYGYYFAWGETSPNRAYSWDTYKYGSGDTNLTKYCTYFSSGKVDNKTVLDASDDAARVNWGAPWHMPTLAECQELVNTCSTEWTSVNGVYGRKFTGVNGSSIFLPAVGYRWGVELYSADSYGYYWSSTLYESSPNFAYGLYFYMGSASQYYGGRNCGNAVRPVRLD